MSIRHAHTEQIKAELLPIYLEAAQKVGTVAVDQIANPGEEFAAYTSSYDNYGIKHALDQGKRRVMDNFTAIQVSTNEDIGDFYHEVANIKAQAESN